MPNWCHNKLIIEGDEKQLKKFKENTKTKESKLSMEKIMPCPQKLTDTKSPAEEEIAKANKRKYGVADWYHWNIKNWGTKWDLANVEILTEDKDCIEYEFDTAWGPADKFLHTISNKYPKLRFILDYYEPGYMFEGTFIVENGQIEEDESHDLETEKCPKCKEDYIVREGECWNC